MGVINIAVAGSFTTKETKQFSAMHGGHALAVAEAISYLSKEILPEAIKHDHNLHEDGAKPEVGFGLSETER